MAGDLGGGLPTPRRIVLIDDHAVFREGLAKILEEQQDLMVCGEADNAAQALTKARDLKPDMAIVDLSLDGASGIDLIKTLRADFPDLRILVLSMHKESVYAERALRAGANGYVMKQQNGRLLQEAIYRVLGGQTYVSDQLNQAILKRLGHPGENHPASPIDRLGEREFEVFRLIARGFGNRQIADELRVSIKTVEAHREHIRDKLDFTTSFELVQYAREWAQTENI